MLCSYPCCRVGGGAGDVEKEVEQVVRESAERLRDHVTRLEEQRRTLTSRSVLPSSSCHRFYYRKRKVRKVIECGFLYQYSERAVGEIASVKDTSSDLDVLNKSFFILICTGKKSRR